LEEDAIMKKRILLLFLPMLIIFILTSCGKTIEENDLGEVITIIHADYPEYDTAQSLVDAADLVFVGQVESVTNQMLDVKTEAGKDSMTGLAVADSIPYTIYEIEVVTVYKGNITGTTISLKRPGGILDGNEYILEGATVVTLGNTYLFTAVSFENSYPSFLNSSQSSYDMNDAAPYSIDEKGITLSQILEIFE